MFSPEKVDFFEFYEKQRLALTFDDVRLVNDKMSDVSAADVDLTSHFSRNIELKIPIVSSPMDTITESAMAIEMAKLGGLGIIHAGLSIEEQAKEVRKVKWNLGGFIHTPKTVSAEMTIAEVEEWCDKKDYAFRSFPVVGEENRLLGMLTQSDFDYCVDKNSETVAQNMTPVESVTTAKPGIEPEAAFELMKTNGKVGALPIIDEDGRIAGLYIKSDVLRSVHENPQNYSLDRIGRLLVGIAVPTNPELAIQRFEAVKGFADVLVIDTARGNSKHMPPTLKQLHDVVINLKRESGMVMDIVAGNVSHGNPAKILYEAGADGIRGGQGGGSICSTRPNTGVGTPQVTSNYRIAKAINGEIPVCSDGGIKDPGDISIAIASGADTVIMGRGLAATKETPGDLTLIDGELKKSYRGMGSEGAIAASNARGYGEEGVKPAPEGVETSLTYRGPVADIVNRYMQYLRASLEYVGAPDLRTHRETTTIDRITNAGLRESHPHDI